jgi:hypothetical protein
MAVVAMMVAITPNAKKITLGRELPTSPRPMRTPAPTWIGVVMAQQMTSTTVNFRQLMCNKAAMVRAGDRVPGMNLAMTSIQPPRRSN